MTTPVPPSPAKRWGPALRGAISPRSLTQTTVAALLVGGTLLMVNLYPALKDGPLTCRLAIQVFLTFFVPWMNATMGIALGLRRSAATAGDGRPSR